MRVPPATARGADPQACTRCPASGIRDGAAAGVVLPRAEGRGTAGDLYRCAACHGRTRYGRRRRSVASNSIQHPELHQPNQDEKTYRQRSEQIYWDLGDVPRVVGSQFRLGIVLVDCLDFLEN